MIISPDDVQVYELNTGFLKVKSIRIYLTTVIERNYLHT